ncbi:hypothetical protein SBON0708_001105 [Salmonella bongori serovar 48:i:- str. 94-0708]|nr:hypothetical protein [Salmonella bongori serovar 48:i:- str. 94-0708]
MNITHVIAITLGIGLLTACHADSRKSRKPPVQVVYRFDDHRYLELEGFYCEGALWYNDTQKRIRAEVVERDTPIFRVSTFKYIHPSERYIAIPWRDLSGFLISRDYGQTWGGARFSPGGGAKRYGDWYPSREDIDSFTVVNDQGFLLTKQGDLYISSKPFDDPRLQPGGEGIDYVYDGEKHHLRPRNNGTNDNSYWGKNYTSWASLQGERPWQTFAYETNWQGIPNKVPEVKNYTGWDHMRCDPDLGLPASERGK